MSRLAKSLIGIEGAMVKFERKSRIYAHNLDFSSYILVPASDFLSRRFEVRAGQKIVKERTSHRVSTNHEHTLTELFAKSYLIDCHS